MYFILPFLLQTLVWVPTRLFLFFFASFEVYGLENIKKIPRGVIFACNHSSEIDPILLPASFPFLFHLAPTFYTSREQSFYKRSGWRQHFYGGTFFKAWGAYPVLSGQHNYELSLSRHITLLKKGATVCIFPEGRKSDDGMIKEGKGGVAYLSWKANVPIVPVHIKGVFRMTLFDLFTRKRKIILAFGKPRSFKDFLAPTIEPKIEGLHDDFRRVAAKVMEEIKALGANTRNP